jgi:hypothetical protein
MLPEDPLQFPGQLAWRVTRHDRFQKLASPQIYTDRFTPTDLHRQR